MAYTLNGEPVEGIPGYEVAGDAILVPVAKIVEMLGGYVTWDNQNKIATLELGDKKAEVQLENKNIVVNGVPGELSFAPALGQGALYVPTDLFTNYLGCNLQIDGENVSISSM